MKSSASRAAAFGALAVCAVVPMAMAQIRPQTSVRAASAEPAAFDIYLPVSNKGSLVALLGQLHSPASPRYHHWLTPSAFATQFGAPGGTIRRIIAEMRANGLAASVTGSHSLHVSGSIGQIERLFSTHLAHARFASGHERLVSELPLTLPASLAAAGAIVPHFAATDHMHTHALPVQPNNRYGANGSYWFDDLKQAYSFPSVTVATGKGVHIGILMSGNYNPADLGAYWSNEGLPGPTVTTTLIYGGAPFTGTGSSLETELDMQQAGGMAPNSTVTLFNVPDLSDASILAGLTTIIEGNTTDIVSMSFGAPELGYSAAYNNGVDMTGFLTVYNDMFMQGNAQGISFVASSGDSGALGIPASACFSTTATAGCGSMVASVESPASSPNVTAVGGTNLTTTAVTGSTASNYVSEAANDDPMTSDVFFDTPATGAVWGSGGGISSFFAQPSYQVGISTTYKKGRLVPDLALHMGGCPTGAVSPCGPNRSSDIAVVNGITVGLVGTSAAAPAFAGLLALKMQLSGGRLGNINFSLYATAKQQARGTTPLVFHTGIPGNNGAYAAGSGFNLVLGNGTLYANAFLGVSTSPVAGNPLTASNP